MNSNSFIPAGKNNIYYMILFIGSIIILSKLFGSIPGIIGAIILFFGIYKTVSRVTLSKNKKILYSIICGIGGIVSALLISLLLQSIFIRFAPSINDQVPYKGLNKNQIVQRFEIYSMKNGLKIAYPSDWSIHEGDNEYVANIQPASRNGLIEVSYNVWSDNQSKSIEEWKSDVITLANSNPEIGIDKSSIVIKKILENYFIFLNTIVKKEGVFARQAVTIIEGSNNNKYIQFTLKTDEQNFIGDQLILDNIISQSLIANSR